MRTVRRIAGDIIIICLIGIMGISGYNICEKQLSYSKDRKVYEQIPSKDFAKLKKMNSDIVGWLKYDGMDIDYPIVQGKDNSKYLNTLFDGSWGNAGCLFVDCICEKPFEQFNTVVYGHHMFDGTMFGKFGKLKEKEYALKHPKFELYTENKTYNLDIVAFLNTPSDSVVYNTNLLPSERAEYIKAIKDEAVYVLDEINEYDRLVLLSTCAYEYQNARYIAVCRMSDYIPKEKKPEKKKFKLPKRFKEWKEYR